MSDEELLHEWRCPNCDAVTRARMADQPPMIDPRHLVGVAELSALFVVGRTTVAMWHARADRNGFPLPVAILAMGPVWDVNEVVAWYGSYKPLKGGRPGRVPDADAVPA